MKYAPRHDRKSRKSFRSNFRALGVFSMYLPELAAIAKMRTVSDIETVAAESQNLRRLRLFGFVGRRSFEANHLPYQPQLQ